MNAGRPYPDRLVEWLFAGMMIIWGAWLLVPWWDTFDNPQYAPLKALGGEEVWGVWSVSIGIVRATALYINGSHRRTPAVRCICAIFGMMWWMTLTWFFLSAPVREPPVIVAFYPLFFFFEIVSAMRSAADAWHVDSFRWRSRPTRGRQR